MYIKAVYVVRYGCEYLTKLGQSRFDINSWILRVCVCNELLHESTQKRVDMEHQEYIMVTQTH